MKRLSIERFTARVLACAVTGRPYDIALSKLQALAILEPAQFFGAAGRDVAIAADAVDAALANIFRQREEAIAEIRFRCRAQPHCCSRPC